MTPAILLTGDVTSATWLPLHGVEPGERGSVSVSVTFNGPADAGVAMYSQGDATGPLAAPPPDTILVVDLSAAWSREVTRYVSATSVAGREVRALNDVYEQHTGRMPLGHLSEGWEVETSLLRKLPFLPFKYAVDLVLVVVTIPLWMPVVALTAVLVLVFNQRQA